MRYSTKRLKSVADLNPEALPEDTSPDLEIRYIDVGAVGRGQLVEDPEVLTFSEAPTRARRRVRWGDTILSGVRTYLRAVLPIGPETEDTVVSTGFVVIRPREIEPRYLAWAVQADPFIEEVVARSVGVSYPAINPSSLGDIRLPVPDRDTQLRVAEFLDRETSRIDALIEAQRSLIDLLIEYRSALIAKAVIGDLDEQVQAESRESYWAVEEVR